MTCCIVCGKPRRETAPATLSKQGRADLLAMLRADPYCSTDCCKHHHGVAVDQPPPPPRTHIKAHGTQQSYKDGCREDCCRLPENERRRLRRASESDEQRKVQNERRRARHARERERESVAA